MVVKVRIFSKSRIFFRFFSGQAAGAPCERASARRQNLKAITKGLRHSDKNPTFAVEKVKTKPQDFANRHNKWNRA
jgi:hypothetical protein